MGAHSRHNATAEVRDDGSSSHTWEFSTNKGSRADDKTERMGVHSRYNATAEVRDDGSLSHTKGEKQMKRLGGWEQSR